MLCHHFLSTIRPMLNNLAKPSTMASETHPSSFKLQATIIHPDILPNNRTSQCHLLLVTSLPENLWSSWYSPRIIHGTLQPENRSSHFDHFHPTPLDGTYFPTIQDCYPISCQSRHGLRICCRHVTVQESCVTALQPKFGHRHITAQESVLGRTSVSLGHVRLAYCFLCKTVSLTNTSFIMYINNLYT